MISYRALRKAFIGLFAVACCFAADQPANTSKKPTVAVYYDGPSDPRVKGYLNALFVENLLGHFALRADVIPVAQYRPGQLAQHYAGFFVGSRKETRLPAEFLSDVRRSSRPFGWLGPLVDQLLDQETSRRLGFRFVESREQIGFTEVSYKGAVLPREEPGLIRVVVQDSGNVNVLATVTDLSKARWPYALRRGDFWFFADAAVSYMQEGGSYLVFCDLLHDILGIDHSPDDRALVRIEDVSVDDDPDDLRSIADLLATEKIPFQFSLIPIFRNPAQGLEVRLSDRRSFTDALHYMIAHGGTPVMHGVTHQYHGQSGDDFEFWDDSGDRPIVGDSTDFVLRRLDLGLSECFAAGIYPIAFETPHYAASEVDYRAFRRVFRLFFDRTMASRSQAAGQFFPYPVVDRFGRYVVPEDLGYLPIDKPDPQAVIAAARNQRVVRDGLATFYFHPFLNPSLLREVVDGIKALGYRFVSLREFGGDVDSRGKHVVRTSPGTVRLEPQNEYWRIRQFDTGGNVVAEQTSGNRLSGAVQLSVQVPSGGWTAVECMKELPVQAHERGWMDRVRLWWRETSRSAVAATGFTPSKEAWVLWLDRVSQEDRNNQDSHVSVLRTFGYTVTVRKLNDFTRAPPSRSTLLVVPRGVGVRLSGEQQRLVLEFLESGGGVVADGRQPWLGKLGFQWQDRTVAISAVTDRLNQEITLRWQKPEQVERFVMSDDIRELMSDRESGQVLAFINEFGSGRYLHLAVPLDPYTPDATSHYPYYPQYLFEAFGASTSLKSPRIEAYFDPSYRPGADLNRLARMWRTQGIRTVYVAAWIHTREFAFPYSEFIQACHRNGVSVYAWLMLPAVTPKMWDEHPEWRERTAAGTDGRVGWRYSMNLQDPVCFRAAMDWMDNLLRTRDWDGVNIAELNFDADFNDYLRPDRFIPMNEIVRRDFQRRSGFDPLLLFKPDSEFYHRHNPGALSKFLRYREEIVIDWHRRILKELEPLCRERNWEVIVTAMDSLHDRYVRTALGVDSRQIAGLMKEFDFTLQVEDPAHFWTASPDRYRRFATTYSKLVPSPKRLMFDVNVVTDRDVEKTLLPSAVATGTELARTVVAAASASGRVAIYSENTVPSQDWSMLKTALSVPGTLEARGDDFRSESPTPALLSPSEQHDYYVDGRLWPAITPEGVILPAGRHDISTERPWHHFLDPGTMPSRLVSISADLLDARADSSGVLLRYRSPSRAVLLLNEKPLQMFVDGKEIEVVSMPAGDYWTTFAPRGEHRLNVITNTKAGVFVNVWSWISASAISLFGALATVLMIGIYVQMWFRRRARRA